MGNGAHIPEELTLTPVDGGSETVPASIEGAVGKGVLRLALDQPLAQGSIVRVAAGDDFWTTGRVLYTLTNGGQHQAAVGMQQDERRTSARIQVDEEAYVVSLHSHSPAECQARVKDVSKAGIGLICGVLLPRDLLVKVKLDSAIIFGDVKHCTPSDGDDGLFKVGIEIQTVIFKDEGSAGWTYKPRELWASFSASLHHLASRIHRR